MNSNERIYVAYGSNINTEQMNFRCPAAEIYGVGMIEGYELNFNKVATLVKKENEQSPALLWKLSSEDEKSLDKFEGYPHKYKKIEVDVNVDGRTVKGMAYVMNNSSRLDIPSDEYYNRIESGYMEMELPLEYLEEAYERAAAETERRFELEYDQMSLYDKEYMGVIQNSSNKQNIINSFRMGIAYAQEFGVYYDDMLSDEEIINLVSLYKSVDDFKRAVNDLKNEQLTDNYYIAYGSNINLSQMKQRCPNSTVIGIGELKGWELKFNSCATIKPNKQKSTPVLVWQIHTQDWERLDAYEGYPSYYRKEILDVTLGNKTHTAQVYIMNCRDDIYSPPTHGYFESIAEGYKQNSMDPAPLIQARIKSVQKAPLTIKQGGRK